MLRGFAKLTKIPKIPQKNWIELTSSTHPPSKLFCGNTSLTVTWAEHSNHNNQRVLAMHIQTEYTWYTTPKYQYWFRAILGRFSTKKFRVRLGPTPPHFHSNLRFFEFFFLCKAPKRNTCVRVHLHVLYSSPSVPACSCHTLGTVGNYGCDKRTGECRCKRYVSGRNCDQCLVGIGGVGRSVSSLLWVLTYLFFGR